MLMETALLFSGNSAIVYYNDNYPIYMHTIRANTVKIHGIKYSHGAVIRIRPNDKCDQDYIYGEIGDVFVYKDHKIFGFNLLQTEEFDEHLRAIRVKRSNIKQLCLYEDFYMHGALHIKAKANQLYIIDHEFTF